MSNEERNFCYFIETSFKLNPLVLLQPQFPEKKKSYKEMREEQRLREEAERRPSLIVPDEVNFYFYFLK